MAANKWIGTVRARLALTALACLALACGSDGSGTGPSGATVGSITLTYSKSTLALGDVQPMGPVFKGSDGTVLATTPTATWTSTNSQVAQVDNSGHVTAVALGGPVTIKVSAGGASATATLSVVPERIFFPANTAASLGVGVTLQMFATPLDVAGNAISASLAPVTWTSTNTAVATVTPGTGLVTGAGPGITQITATAAGQSNSVNLEVGVVSPYDGAWTGLSVAGGHQVDFIVLFGSVRTFKETFILFTLPYSHTCAPSVTAFGSPNAAITNSQMAFNLTTPPTTTVSGTFTSNTTLTGNLSAIALGSFPCLILETGEIIPPPNNGPMNANEAATTFTAAKQ